MRASRTTFGLLFLLSGCAALISTLRPTPVDWQVLACGRQAWAWPEWQFPAEWLPSGFRSMKPIAHQ